jgi:O-antigen/teichoic acid export membrane protein
VTRVVRSALNYLTSVLLSATTLLVGFWATRYILRWLGDERAGAFRAAGDWLGYLTLMELGLGGALMPLIARALQSRDPESLRGLMAQAFRMYRWVALAMAGGALLFVPVIHRLVPVNPALVGDLRAAIWIGALAALVGQFAPLRPLWEADQRGYVVNIVLAMQSVVIVAASLLLARDGWGIAGQQIAVLIGSIVYTLVLLWQTIKRHPEAFGWMLARADPAAGREIWKLNWPTLVVNLSGRASFLADNIVIAYFLAPAAVVPFWYTQALTRVAATQLQAIGNATWAGLAQLHHTGQRHLFDQRVQELTRLTVIIGAGVLVPIAAYNGTFVRLWLGTTPDRFGGYALTALAATNALLLALSSLWGWLFSGTGLTARLAPLVSISAGLNLAVSIGATALLARAAPHLALLGPLIGTALALATVNLFGLPLLIARTFNVKVSHLARATLVPLLAAIPYAAVVVLISRAVPPRGWIGLAGYMSVASAVFLVAAFFLVLPARERELWRLRLRLALAALRDRSTASDESQSEAEPKAPAPDTTTVS